MSVALNCNVSTQKTMNAPRTDQLDVELKFMFCEAIAAHKRDVATVSWREKGEDAVARCVPCRDDVLVKLKDCEALAVARLIIVAAVVMLRTDAAIDWNDAILLDEDVKDAASAKIACMVEPKDDVEDKERGDDNRVGIVAILVISSCNEMMLDRRAVRLATLLEDDEKLVESAKIARMVLPREAIAPRLIGEESEPKSVANLLELSPDVKVLINAASVVLVEALVDDRFIVEVKRATRLASSVDVDPRVAFENAVTGNVAMRLSGPETPIDTRLVAKRLADLAETKPDVKESTQLPNWLFPLFPAIPTVIEGVCA